MSTVLAISGSQGLSSGFYQYIKKIGEVSSRQEEDEIVIRDLQKLKLVYSGNNEDPTRAKENVIRVIYAEMLGHPAEFGHIHCVNLSSSSTLSFKRTGYLATWLCIPPENELMYLTVANIQKDLRSPSFLEVSAALDGAMRFLRPELISVVVSDVTALLTHNKVTVRRKAVEALHAFYVRTEGEVADVSAFRQALCDRDPSVMGAAVRLLFDVIRRHPRSQLDLLDSFLSILTQVTERRLPRSFDYHRTPAPWLQITLLQLLTVLVGHDRSRAEKCAPVLREAMLRADNGTLIGFAIICEVVRTASTIPPVPSLTKLCSEAVTRFVSSSSANLRLAGINALTQLALVDPSLSTVHQTQVMNCLEDPDDTIRRRTLVLLLAICTSDNVQPIVTRFIHFVQRTTDPFLRQQTTMAVCQVAERYAHSPQWFILTMNRLIAVAGECVPPSASQRMLKLIAEGQGDDVSDTEFRAGCVEDYFNLMGASRASGTAAGARGVASVNALPRGFRAQEAASAAHSEPLMRIAAWVMGEYGFLSKRISRAMLLDRLCDMMDRTEANETRCWLVTAMMKLVAHNPEACPENVQEVVAHYQDSRSTNLQQRCNEFLALLKLPAIMRKVLPLDGCCEDIQVDEKMTSLDSLVEQALTKGARAYDGNAARRYQVFHATSTARTGAALRTEAYAPASKWASLASDPSAALAPGGPSLATLAAAASADDATAWESQLRLQSGGTTRRWGVQNLELNDTVPTDSHRDGSATGTTTSAAELSLPATMNRWSAQGGPVAPAFGQPPEPQPSAGAHAWELQGTSEESGAGATAPPRQPQSHNHSAKTEKFVSAIFGGGRGKRRQGSRATAGAAAATATRQSSPPASTPAPSAAASSRQPVTYDVWVRDDIDRRRAAALDDLFGDDTASSPVRTVQASTVDALFASSPVSSPPALRHSSVTLSARRDTAKSVYVVTLRAAAEGRTDVSPISVELTPPSGCVIVDARCRSHPRARVEVRAPAISQGNSEAQATVLTLTDVPRDTTLEVEFRLGVAHPSVFLRVLDTACAQRTSLNTTVACPSAADNSVDGVALPFAIAHVLRPAAVSFQTAQFGEEWVNATREAHGQLARTSTPYTASRIAEEVAPQACLRVVEVIGLEVIAAAELVTSERTASGSATYALCHFQIGENGLDTSVLVHSRSAGLTQMVLQAVSGV